MLDSSEKPDGVVQYDGDGEFYAYKVESRRIVWCVRVSHGEIPPGQIGQRLHQQILDDAQRQQEKRQ